MLCSCRRLNVLLGGSFEPITQGRCKRSCVVYLSLTVVVLVRFGGRVQPTIAVYFNCSWGGRTYLGAPRRA